MIGKRIRLARLHRGLTLRELGEALRVSPQAVAQWEKGTPNLSDDRSYNLANVLDVNIDWLRGTTGDDESVVVSLNKSEFNNDVPVIDFDDALRYMVISRNSSKNADFSAVIRPSAKIVGQGFAVVVPEDQQLPPKIIEGDLLIFDNAIKPTFGDIVIALCLNDGLYYTIIAGCIPADDQIGISIVAPKGSDAYEHLEAAGGATPIAVMVEHRSLRQNTPRLPGLEARRPRRS